MTKLRCSSQEALGKRWASAGVSPNLREVTFKALRLFHQAKRRSRQRGWVFELTQDDMTALVVQSKGLCAVTGLPFYSGKFKECRVHPLSPSIDRIDSTKGYVVGNVRLVCYAANMGMMDWGLEFFKQICGHVSANLGTTQKLIRNLTVRDMAQLLGMPKSTVQLRLSKGKYIPGLSQLLLGEPS